MGSMVIGKADLESHSDGWGFETLANETVAFVPSQFGYAHGRFARLIS